MLLKDKSVLITGSGRGIGRATAIMMAREGAKVVVNDIDPEPAREVVGEINKNGGVAVANSDTVATMKGAEAIIKAAIDNFGRIDVLVNNAAILRDAMMHKMTEQEWDDSILIVLKGPWMCTKAALPYMIEQKSGRIIYVTSWAGLRGNIGQANYCAAKSGIIGLTRSNAKEFARHNITVNCVAPAAMTRLVAQVPEKILGQMEKQIPLGRFGTPEDIAPLFVFLASDWSGYMTGQVIGIDGGMTI